MALWVGQFPPPHFQPACSDSHTKQEAAERREQNCTFHQQSYIDWRWKFVMFLTHVAILWPSGGVCWERGKCDICGIICWYIQCVLVLSLPEARWSLLNSRFHTKDSPRFSYPTGSSLPPPFFLHLLFGHRQLTSHSVYRMSALSPKAHPQSCLPFRKDGCQWCLQIHGRVFWGFFF